MFSKVADQALLPGKSRNSAAQLRRHGDCSLLWFEQRWLLPSLFTMLLGIYAA